MFVERNCVAATLQAHIQELLDSHLGWDINYRDRYVSWSHCGFPRQVGADERHLLVHSVQYLSSVTPLARPARQRHTLR
jgi:hypothetical protein